MNRFLRRSSPAPRLTLGVTTHRLFPRPVNLTPAELARHKHIIGISGSGKSTFLAAYVVQLINQGIGVSLIDPQGDLAILVMRILAEQGYFEHSDAFDQLRYIDFSDDSRVPPMNVLNQPNYADDVVAKALSDVCLRVWSALGEGAAPTFENIIKHAGIALVQARLPLTKMQDFLVQQDYRNAVLERVSEPQVHRFFKHRYDAWGRDGIEKRESTLNRLDLFTISPRMRAILGAQTNLLNYRQLMDEGTSVIYNLGSLDGEMRRFLGAFIAYGYEKAASSRDRVPEEERRMHILIMDEFALFSAQSSQALEEILSGARKYKLFLHLAHQNFGQTDTRLKAALQNAATIAFQLNRDDAVWMAPRLAHFNPHEVKHEVEDEHAQERTHPVFTSLPEQFEKQARELEDLPIGHCYTKFGSTVRLIRTVPYPKPTIGLDRLREITDEYARRLLVPIAEEHAETTVFVSAVAARRISRRVPRGE
jgi:hypothetical protein